MSTPAKALDAYVLGDLRGLFDIAETALAELAVVRLTAQEWHAERLALIDPVTGDWDDDADGTVWESDDEAVQILRVIAEGAQS